MNPRLIPQRLSKRSFLALIVHGVVFAAVYWLSYWVRFDFAIDPRELITIWVTLPAVLVVKLGIFYAFGHCHRSWRYVSFSDLYALLSSATISAGFLWGLDGLARNYHVPKGVLLLDWAMTILVLGGLYALNRLSREELRPRLMQGRYQKALIIGANQSGETLARHLLADQNLNYQVIGFLDQDHARHGTTLNGIPVLGTPEQAVPFALNLGADHLLVISGVLSGTQVRRLMEECEQEKLTLKVIPALDDLLTSNYSVQIRNVDINDLLRREPVQLNSDAISSLIAGRTVMVTGAGGSIGSEICRQVLKFRPKALVMVERAENSLFAVEQEFQLLRNEVDIHPCIADISDRGRMDQVFDLHRPNVVFHAAAHKHVPLMEHNPGEAIKNNVLGTMQLAETAEKHGVQEFVMISTDKAVNPTSIMGVSKQLAERFVHAFSEASKAKFVVVRFGNVLASNGSVVPIFQQQILRGGPITVTHPEIERFFMTIPEASQLVLQAAAMGKGGEIFVLDMGESVRIVDLAKDLIRLSGLKPDDIEIVYTGLRPGEKLYEELYFEDEEMQPTPHPKLFVAYHRLYNLSSVRQSIAELVSAANGAPDVLRTMIKEIVPEFDTVRERAAADNGTANGSAHGPRRTSQPTTALESS